MILCLMALQAIPMMCLNTLHFHSGALPTQLPHVTLGHVVNCNLQDWPGDDETNDVEFRYLCGNTDHSGALEEAGIIEADAIIIGPADDLSDNEVRSALCFHTCL